VLETGDLAVHDEEVYPPQTLVAVGAAVGAPAREQGEDGATTGSTSAESESTIES
jgi:hypothetical protein